MTSHEHGQDAGEHNGHEHDHGSGNATMCVCEHNPGAECHCPPNEFKCDQQHHLTGAVQTASSCCNKDLSQDS